MKTYYFEHTSLIPVKQSVLFDFHTDTNNLPSITPPNTKVKILDISLPLRHNSPISLAITRMGMTLNWKLHIDAYQPPMLIVDVADQSPFHTFRHEHHFIAHDENATLLQDHVQFSLPFDPLSRLLVSFVMADLKKMFIFRHEQTKKILCS